MPTNPQVGSLYEIALNGVGLMLADSLPDPAVRVQRRTSALTPPRLATTETPFSEAIDRYAFFGQSDFSDGAGQRLATTDRSSPAAYLDSIGVNPFTGKGLEPLPKMVLRNFLPTADQYVIGMVRQGFDIIILAETVSGGTPSASEVYRLDGTTWTLTSLLAVTSATTVLTGICTDGDRFYVIDHLGRIRRSDNLTVVWATVGVPAAGAGRRNRISFIGDRLTGTGNDGVDAIWTTVTMTGTVEVPAGRFRLTDTTAAEIISAVAEDSGYAYFGAGYSDGSSSTHAIYAWQIGSADAPKAVFKTSGHVRNITAQGGQLYVQTTTTLYRGIIQADGRLTMSVVYTFPFSGSLRRSGASQRMLITDDGLVIVPHETVVTEGLTITPGLTMRALNPATGGWANWWFTTDPTTTSDVAVLASLPGGEPVMAAGRNIYSLATADPKLVQGELITSYTDFGTLLSKKWDDLAIRVDKGLLTPAITTVGLTFVGGNGTTSPLTATTNFSGVHRAAVGTLNADPGEAAIRIALQPGPTETGGPWVRSFQLRAHSLPPVDQVVQLPVHCGDHITGLAGQPLPENGPGAGVARRQTLEALVGTVVDYQDRDGTGTTAWEVESVAVEEWHVPDRNTGRQAHWAVALVTIRKART